VFNAAIQAARHVTLALRAQGYQQRQEVFFGGVGAHGMRRLGPVAHDRLHCIGQHCGAHPVGKLAHIVFAPRTTLAEFAQVVGHAARRQNQHALRTQWRQRPAQLNALLGGQVIGHRHLKHRQVGLGQQMHQRYPSAMVKALARIHIGRKAGGA